MMSSVMYLLQLICQRSVTVFVHSCCADTSRCCLYSIHTINAHFAHTTVHLYYSSFSQIQKLLTMYTPGDFEGKVPSSIIRLIGEKCRRRDGSDGQQLLVHTDDSLLTPYATASGVHSPNTITNLRSLSVPNSLVLDHLLIMI